MPFPQAHHLLALSGPLFAAERWSIGLRTSDDDFVSSEAAALTRAEPIFDAVQAWWAANNVVAQPAGLDLLKYNLIGTDGRYARSFTVLRELETPVRTAITSNLHAPQVSLVATLRTPAQRGLASRGRVFMPSPQGAIGSDGRMSTGAQANYVTGMKELLDAINAALPAGELVVASDQGAGAMRPITRVEVGRVLDTMRSRRTSLEEERVSADLAAPS